MTFRFSSLTFLLVGLLLTLFSCKDNKEEVKPDYAAQDEATIQQYIKDKNLTGFVRDTSGVYVAITQPGTGANARKNQRVQALYTGSTLDGTVFDSNLTTLGLPFVLGQNLVIRGWSKGFQYFNTGAKGILLIPSGMAYGETGNGKIGPNTVLRFDVQVVDIK